MQVGVLMWYIRDTDVTDIYKFLSKKKVTASAYYLPIYGVYSKVEKKRRRRKT